MSKCLIESILARSEYLRGLTLIGKFVCAECIDDLELKSFVESNSTEFECSYCGKDVEEVSEGIESEPISIDVDDLINRIEERLEVDYDDPVNCLPYESREGGWQASTVWTTYELFQDELGGFPTSNNELNNDILHGIDATREWCQRDPFVLSAQEALPFAWDEFCRKIKYQTRFLFFDPDGRREEVEEFRNIHPSEMLNVIGRIAKEYKLDAELPAGTLFYRGRVTEAAKPFKTIEELGPPPQDKSQTNRMNAAGISMFYGADSIETCLAELTCKRREIISIGEFELLNGCTIIDLTSLPEYQSIYSDASPEMRASISFLHRFVIDAIEPVERDGREHIDYVPTQVVTEYFRYRFELPDATGNRLSIMGIRYPSSKHEGGVNTALFIKQANCEGIKQVGFFPEEKWLKLNSTEDRKCKYAARSARKPKM